MKLKINAHPEIFQECPIITADILIDLNQVGGENSAVDCINALRSGLHVYEKLTLASFVDEVVKKKPNSILGVALEWVK